MFDKLITIIGAGPAGLTVARLLQMRGAAVRLFELDASFSARGQIGISFDIHDDGGQKAIKKAKLFDEFKKFARPEGQSLKILDKYGKIHYEDFSKTADMSRPEIDRQALRKILLNSLEPNTVIWNKHVTNIETVNNGQHKVVFKDGTSEITDFLVGADGTWSKVRPLLSSVRPNYTGVTIVEARIINPKMTSPLINELVGHGTASALGNNKGLMSQRNGDGSIRIYVALRVPEDWMKDFDFNQPSATRAMLLENFTEWQPDLLQMLKHSDDYFVRRPIYSLPLEQYWNTKPGLTVIGDAAHVMTPFAGQGANVAMLDALELADCLTSENSVNLATALKNFEETMINRARIFSEESFNNMNFFMADDSPKQVVDMFNSHRLPE